MNDVPQGFLTSSDCFLCVIAWNVPKPSGGCRLSKVGSKFPSGFFFMETQTPSKATSHQSLWSLQVVCMNFFDIVLDFILMDAFEDLESPPSSVVAVLRNRWLSDSFKETVNKLHVDASHSSSICFTHLTREWCASVLLPGSGNSLLVCLESEKTSSHGELTCDHMLRTLPGVHASWHLDPIRLSTQVPDGFISHFYAISEHVSPVLAFGFLGPRRHLSEVCTIFKVRRIPAFLNQLWI